MTVTGLLSLPLVFVLCMRMFVGKEGERKRDPFLILRCLPSYGKDDLSTRDDISKKSPPSFFSLLPLDLQDFKKTSWTNRLSILLSSIVKKKTCKDYLFCHFLFPIDHRFKTIFKRAHCAGRRIRKEDEQWNQPKITFDFPFLLSFFFLWTEYFQFIVVTII